MDESLLNDQIRKLNQFIVNNSDLENLEVLTKEFNPLRVLKVNNYEIRHSNLLAWLLNPNENHNLGDMLLKKILTGILSNGEEVEILHELTIPQVLISNFHDVTVAREWNNIDLLLVSRSNDMVLFIENKIHAGLGEYQLEKYLKIIKESYPNTKHIIPVFLTLSGDEAPHPNYYKYSHIEISQILKSVSELYKDRINEKIYDFIKYYVSVLEELTMQDERVVQLCKDIYKNYKDAIDLIVTYGIDTSSSFHDALQELKKEYKFVDYMDGVGYSKSNNEYWFLPESLRNIGIPQATRWKSPLAVSYFFLKEEKSLKLFLEVGPMADTRKRLEFLNHLNNSNFFSPKEKSLTKIDGKFTKIRTASHRFTEWDDIEAVQEAVISLLNKFKFNEVNEELEHYVRDFQF
jgi:hypothetical protein